MATAKVKAQSTLARPRSLVWAQSGDGLDPAEGLLNALADTLAGGITGVPRRPPVDRRASAAGVLRHVRAHAQAAQFLDEVGRIVSAIGTERDCACAVGDALHHIQRRQPLGVS